MTATKIEKFFAFFYEIAIFKLYTIMQVADIKKWTIKIEYHTKGLISIPNKNLMMLLLYGCD